MLLDEVTELKALNSPIVPAWKALKNSKADYITWFQETNDTLQHLSQHRIETFINNLLWYTGEYDKTLEYRVTIPGRSDVQVARKMVPRIFNHLHDITEQRVSKLSRLKPTFDIVPTNKEEKDRLVARLLKVALDATARRVHMEFMMQEVERWNSVFGEIYVSIEWNKDIGDRVGKGKLERVGDVDIKIKAPWTVFPEPKRHWQEVMWCIDIESIMNIEEARIRFNKKNLEPDNKRNIFSFNTDVQEKRDDEVVVYRVIVPPSEFLPEGNIRYVINDEIVDDIKEYPYSHFEFPFERHTDIDVPGRLFPESFYKQIKPVQHVYNKLTSIVTRNILLAAHPHILMPKGAAKIESFGNGPTAIEYQGQVPPQIITFNSVPNEVFQFRTEVKQEIGQISGIQGVSRGAPPPGARSASMLRFYEEQEEQRASTHIIKHNELIRRIFLKAGSVIGDYYPEGSKERLIRVVGKENEYDIQAFSKVKISAEYDVIIQNSTGFSESKAIRFEEISQLQEMSKGTLFTNDQIADILEFKNVQKMYDISTAAIKQAEDENERIKDGHDIAPPKPYQDLIVHWRTHIIEMNSSTWENSVPEAIKEKLIEHVMTTERLMEEKATANHAFAQKLSQLDGYPAFWTLSAPPEEVRASNREGAPPLPPEAQPPQGPQIPPPQGQELPPEGVPPEAAGPPLPEVPSALNGLVQ